jgi:branched-subunit amino acid ABC-type transport system permease component
MELRDILMSALALGALYSASSVALALIWGTIGMLNLAHGAFITIGAYASLLVVQNLGLPWWTGLPAGALAGAIAGSATYFLLVAHVFRRPNFEINIIILTMALSTIIVDLINNLIGPTSARQPFYIDGRISLGGSGIAWQTILMVVCCFGMVFALRFLIAHTALGRSIRAVAQEPIAAQLNGLSVLAVVLQIMVIAGMVAGASGVLVSFNTTVYPTVGGDPLLKALIICVVGGLGSVMGAFAASFLLALIEVFVQYEFGTRWGLPALLVIVVAVLVIRPNGLFGAQELVRH